MLMIKLGRKLKDIPVEELFVGMKFLSLTNSPGEITKIDWEDRDPPSVWIEWENGNSTWWWSYQLEVREILD